MGIMRNLDPPARSCNDEVIDNEHKGQSYVEQKGD